MKNLEKCEVHSYNKVR